jgi:hypothetical protein
MPIAVVAAVVGVGATIGSTMMGMQAAKKQKKAMGRMVAAQKERNQLETARQAVLNQRERVQQVREARIRRANVVAGVSNAGVGVTGGSSGVSGATSSIQSQLGQNLGTLGQMSSFAQQLSVLNQKEADAQSEFFNAGQKGQMWQSVFGAVGQVAGGVNSFMGGAKESITGGSAGGGGFTFKDLIANPIKHQTSIFSDLIASPMKNATRNPIFN